jgi:hypothetical protein
MAAAAEPIMVVSNPCHHHGLNDQILFPAPIAKKVKAENRQAHKKGSTILIRNGNKGTAPQIKNAKNV